jgi:two-component system chemotaxis response regulator CheY
LIADDASVARKIMRNAVAEGGHEVVCEASTGAEAVEAYRRLRPDLVLMDLTMPEVGGIEASRTIIGEFPDARIVIVTSIKSEAMVRESAEAGVAAYVLKPFSADRILEIAEGLLTRASGTPRSCRRI